MRIIQVIRGYRVLPWDDEDVPVDLHDWLMPVATAVDHIQSQGAGGKEIKLAGAQAHGL